MLLLQLILNQSLSFNMLFVIRIYSTKLIIILYALKAERQPLLSRFHIFAIL